LNFRAGALVARGLDGGGALIVEGAHLHVQYFR
jgi:hypothetical protein